MNFHTMTRAQLQQTIADGHAAAKELQRRHELTNPPGTLCSEEQESTWGLLGAKPGCDGRVLPQNGGGVACNKCGGWFCF